MSKNLWTWIAAIVAGVFPANLPEIVAAETAHVAPPPSGGPVPLIVAADRGFQGNAEIRDAVEAFTQGTSGEVVFVTDERTHDTLRRSVKRLAETGAKKAVVLPIFLSESDPQFLLAQRCLAECNNSLSSTGESLVFTTAKPFGQSYFAVEILADRFRTIANPAGRDVIVLGCAEEMESAQSLEKDWQRLAALAAEGFGFKSVRALVWPTKAFGEDRDKAREVERALADFVIAGERVAVVPFHFGKKLDGMMTFNAALKRRIPKVSEWIDGDVTPHPALTQWIAREVNRQTEMRPEDLGVVFLAHGADYHWNETMREAVASLTDRYKIEFCFSMADPPLIERAVRRLEKRGARAIVVVRVFGLAGSFARTVKRSLGLDVEEVFSVRGELYEALCSPDPQLRINQTSARAVVRSASTHDAHGSGHGHWSGPQPRIRTTALLTTVGGLEDHPLFASALLARAQALSKNPSRETIILVAHGSGDDATNDHWRRILDSLATQMRTNGGANFRAIRTGTWREDWPDKRAPEVAAIRRVVEEAARDGGRAIVIPARTAVEGSEREFLKGLDFELGSGFAPHPLFHQWLEEKIREGIEKLELKNHSSRFTITTQPAAKTIY